MDVLEPKYTCISTNLQLARHSWGVFLVDAVKQITTFLLKLPTAASEIQTDVCVLIFSNDVALLAGNSLTKDTEQVSYFEQEICEFCEALHLVPSNYRLRVRLLSTNVSGISSESWKNSELESSIQILLKNTLRRNFTSFSSIVNSVLYYDEEVRKIISSNVPTIAGKIVLPQLHGVDCTIYYELFPSTISSAQAVHGGLSSPELFSIAPRDSVDPTCIEGRGLRVKACRRETGNTFKSEKR